MSSKFHPRREKRVSVTFRITIAGGPKMCALNLIGGIHKLREQGRGRGVVLKMFMLVHKGKEGVLQMFM